MTKMRLRKELTETQKRKNTNYNSMQQLSIKRKTFLYVSGDLDRMNVSLKPLHLV